MYASLEIHIPFTYFIYLTLSKKRNEIDVHFNINGDTHWLLTNFGVALDNVGYLYIVHVHDWLSFVPFSISKCRCCFALLNKNLKQFIT